MSCAPSSGLWVPGLAGGVPMGMRHAASGIGLWPGAAAAHAARSSDIEINRLIRKSGDLLPGAAIIIHSAFTAAQNSAAASPRFSVPAWPCPATAQDGASGAVYSGHLLRGVFHPGSADSCLAGPSVLSRLVEVSFLAEKQPLTTSSKRWFFAVWLVLIGSFALLHALHLRADFPNHTPWFIDWAKYTDEGWYGNAAVRAHLFGNWYLPGDFNPAPAVPVWPFLEWLLFFFTGVTVQAARGLAVAFFFCNLLLSYLLLRARGPRWMALLALTLLVTSPFLYCFSRLAILEPMLTGFTLGALNLAVRLPRLRRPVWASVWIGLLFTLMMLTKTTAVFLLPALGWAMLLPLWQSRKLALRCALAASGAFAVGFGLWMS